MCSMALAIVPANVDEIPTSMRLLRMDDRASCPAPSFPCIAVTTGATPAIMPGFALIKVAASVIGHDDFMYKNATMGLDVTGTIVGLGAGCAPRLAVGDRVWGTFVWDFDPVNPVKGPIKEYGTGGMAEYANIVCNYTSQAPSSSKFDDLVAAATIPGDAETSLGALELAGAPWTDATEPFTVIINAGTGGTGYSAVQMAKIFGAQTKHGVKVVTAAGGDAGVAFVRQFLGPGDVVVDYHKESLYDAVPDRSVDLVYDNLGRAEDVEKAMAKLKSPGGVFLSIAASTAHGSSHPPPGVRQLFYYVWENTQRTTYVKKLDTLKRWVEDGDMRIEVNRTYTFDHVRAAYAQFEHGGINSRIAIVP